jgi:hypothetical protein
MLAQKEEALAITNREPAATDQHRKRVSVGIAHLANVMPIVRAEDEALPTGRGPLLQGIKQETSDQSVPHRFLENSM